MTSCNCFIRLIHNVFRGITFYIRNIHLLQVLLNCRLFVNTRIFFLTGSGIGIEVSTYGHYIAFFKRHKVCFAHSHICFKC